METPIQQPQTNERSMQEPSVPKKRVYLCDRCGFEMVEKNCKVACKNCGNRFDCSDLNIYFD
jgi:hypothetical protein